MTVWSWPKSTISRVVDGDTVDAAVTRDLGFGGFVTFPIRLRLARINAPAMSEVEGPDARDYLVSLLAVPTVDLVTLKPYKYGGVDGEVGEWVTEITLPDGRNASDVMVTSGHAVKWDGHGPKPGGERP